MNEKKKYTMIVIGDQYVTAHWPDGKRETFTRADYFPFIRDQLFEYGEVLEATGTIYRVGRIDHYKN